MPICFCAIGCQHSTFNRLFGCVFLVWRRHLRKVNKSSVHTSRRFFMQFSYLLVFLNIQIDLIILKTYDQQFTLTTKKSLHIIFNKILSWGCQLTPVDPCNGRQTVVVTVLFCYLPVSGNCSSHISSWLFHIIVHCRISRWCTRASWCLRSVLACSGRPWVPCAASTFLKQVRYTRLLPFYVL